MYSVVAGLAPALLEWLHAEASQKGLRGQVRICGGKPRKYIAVAGLAPALLEFDGLTLRSWSVRACP